MASWDPTSYLSNAAMTQSVQRDMVASATQIINYYEYVTSHLESKKLTNEVVQKVEEQKGLLLEESICEESMVVPPEVVHISDAERRQVDDGTNAVWLKGVAMCVPFTIQCSTPHSTNEELVAWVQRQTTKTFGAMHSVFGHHADSEVSLLTDQETMVVSTDLCTVLAAALDLQVQTNGLFCVTAGSLRSVYDNAIDGTAVGDGVFVDPSTPESPLHASFQQALQALSSPVGLERSTRRVSKAKGVSLDFGGIAKGYICDVLLTALRSCDLCSFSGVMVEWGGDVATWGQPSSKRRWTMGIVKPPRLDSLYHSWKRGSTAGTASDSPSTTTGLSSDAVEYLHSVELTNGDLSCAATSGDYEQTRRFGFIHVVNPKDQRLLRAQSQTIASVTVLSSSAMMADALATALFASHVLDAAVPLAKSLTASSGLHRYYLYVRNFQQFVHNEEPHNGKSNDGPHEGHHSDETMTVDVRSMRVEARAAAVSRTNNADAFHHATTHPEQHDAEQQLAEDLKYLSGLTAHNEAIIVFNAEQNEGVHYAQLSSCEFIFDEGAVQYVVFNVMKGSALLNAVVASGSKFALHIVTSRDDQLWEELRHNRTTWMQMNGNRLIPLDRSVKTFEALRNETKVTIATTEVATVAGDHWVVVARLKDSWPPWWASIRRTTGAAEGLHVAPCCIGGTHRMFGKVSCAGYGLRTCSLHPSMICCVVHSDMVSRMLSQLASPDVSLVLPLQSDEASRLLTSRVLQDSTIEVSASVVHQRQGAVPTWAAATVEGRLLDILHPTERTMVLLIVVRQVTLHQQPGSILSVPCF